MAQGLSCYNTVLPGDWLILGVGALGVLTGRKGAFLLQTMACRLSLLADSCRYSSQGDKVPVRKTLGPSGTLHGK